VRYLDNLLNIVGQLALDVLQSTQQERTNHLMKPTNDKKSLFFNLVASARVSCYGENQAGFSLHHDQDLELRMLANGG